MGCCLLTLLLLGAPRVAFVLWWIFQPVRFQATFNSFFVPLLGVIFIPWTSLMYVLVFPGGITAFEWALIVFAFLVDIASYGGGGRAYRTRY
jgi:hypothetical protein